MIRIEAPTGEIIEFPDGMADADIEAVMRREFGGSTAQAANPEPPKPHVDTSMNAGSASTMSGTQMLTFGASDEIMAGLMTPVEMAVSAWKGRDASPSASYSRLLEFQRAQLGQAQAEHPVASTVGGIAGGLVGGGGAAKAGLTLSKPGVGITQRVVRGAGDGAIAGGIYGFNSGEGFTDRVSDAVGGATMGAGLGGAVPLIGGVVGGAAKPLVDSVKARMNPKGYAAAKVAERLSANSMTPDQASQRIADAQKRGVSLSLADTGGKSARSLLRTTTNIPGPAQDRVATQLTVRAMGQGDRLKSLVRDTLADPDAFLTSKEVLKTTMSQNAKPAFEAAFKRSVPITPQVANIFKRPAAQIALRNAIKLAQNEGVSLNGPNTRTIAYATRALDDMIAAETDSITKRVTQEGKALGDMRKVLADHLKRWNPDYKKATEVWATGSQIDEAMEFGREILRMSPETVKRQTAGMSKAQLDGARIGAADAIRDQIGAAGFTHNAIIRFFNSRDRVGALKAIFPDEKAFAQFRKTIFDEARKRSTYEAVKGNSNTARQLADMAEAGGLQEVVDVSKNVAQQGIIPAGVQFIATRLKMLGGFTPKVADEVSKILMNRDPAAVQQIAQQLQQISQQQLTATQRRQAISAMLSRVLPMQAVAVGR